MSRHTGLFMGIKATHTAPIEAWKHAKNGANIMGYMMPLDDKLVIQANGEVWDDATFMKFQDEFKAVDRYVFLGNFPEDYDEADAQPYPVLNDEDGNVLVGMLIEGDYSGLKQNGSTRADEYRFKTHVLDPMLKKYLETAGDDASPDGFLEYAKQMPQQAEMFKACNGRGVVILLANTGKSVVCSKNELGAKFPWGSLSQANGYSEGEPAKAEPKETEQGVMVLAPKKKKLAVATAEPPAPAPAPAPEPPPVSPPPAKKDDKVAMPQTNKPGESVVPDKQTSVFKPPEGHCYARPIKGLSNTETKDIYNQLGGFVPSKNAGNEVGWKDRPWMLSPVDKALKLSAKNRVEVKDENAFHQAVGKLRENKDTAPHSIPSKADVAQAAKAVDIPVIPPNQIQDFKDKFLKSEAVVKSRQVQGLPTLAQLEAIEKEHPSFTQKVGMTLDEVIRLPYHKKLEMISQYSHTAGLCMHSLCLELNRVKLEVSALKSKATPAQEEQPTDAPVQTKKKKLAIAG